MSRQIKEYNVYFCETCESKPEFKSPEEVMEHLRIVHGIQKGTKGTRSMLAHIDGRDYYKYAFAWEIGGVKLTQETQNRRAKDDPMRYC